MKRAAKFIRSFAGGYVNIALDVLVVWFVQEYLGFSFPFLVVCAGAIILAFVFYVIAAGIEEWPKFFPKDADEPVIAHLDPQAQREPLLNQKPEATNA